MELLIVLGVVLFGLYMIYVTVIKRRNTAQEALSSIDVQLRKRHDLIPNIVTLAQKFMTHEKDLLQGLTEARNLAHQSYEASDPDAVQKHLEAERSLQSGMMQLFAVAENYPELRSSETIQNAQQTFSEVEGHIAAARRFYNSAVTDLKNACEIFPMSMVAAMVGVKPLPFFEVEEAVREPVMVADLMD